MRLKIPLLNTLSNALSGSAAMFWLLLGLFIVVNILDGHSTYQVLRPHYYERERNPVARWVFRKLGLPSGIIIFKVLLLLILIPAMAYYGGHDLFTINIVLIVSNLVFIFVVRHNYKVYSKIRRMR